uniref:Aminotransferase-like plant mobile domain-containing protein n=1 Tax=Fagus sylvatica TaxID=28930 RepID=A0A2N9GEP3_FAGSY
MRHIVGKLSTSSFQRYKVCANRSSDEGVMAPGSRGVGAVFVHFSGVDSGQTGNAIGEPRVPRRSRSHYLSNAPGLADQLVASRKDSAREGGSCAAYFCKVPDLRKSELGLVRYGPANRGHRGVFGPFEGSFPIGIPAGPDKFLAIREFHVVHGCVLFPMCPGSQINLLRVRKTLCASVATSVGKFRNFQQNLILSACFHARGRRSSRCRIPTILVSSESLRYLLFNGTGLAQRRAWVREDMILRTEAVGMFLMPRVLATTLSFLVRFRPVKYGIEALDILYTLVKGWSVRSSFWSGQWSGQTLVKLGQPWSNLVELGQSSPNSWRCIPDYISRVSGHGGSLVGLETARSNLGQTSVNPSQTWSTLVKLGQTLGNVSRTFFLGVFDVAKPCRQIVLVRTLIDDQSSPTRPIAANRVVSTVWNLSPNRLRGDLTWGLPKLQIGWFNGLESQSKQVEGDLTWGLPKLQIGWFNGLESQSKQVEGCKSGGSTVWNLSPNRLRGDLTWGLPKLQIGWFNGLESQSKQVEGCKSGGSTVWNLSPNRLRSDLTWGLPKLQIGWFNGLESQSKQWEWGPSPVRSPCERQGCRAYAPESSPDTDDEYDAMEDCGSGSSSTWSRLIGRSAGPSETTRPSPQPGVTTGPSDAPSAAPRRASYQGFRYPPHGGIRPRYPVAVEISDTPLLTNLLAHPSSLVRRCQEPPYSAGRGGWSEFSRLLAVSRPEYREFLIELGFGPFLSIPYVSVYHPAVWCFIERFFHHTGTFHLSTCEMAVLPVDWSAILGIRFGGRAPPSEPIDGFEAREILGLADRDAIEGTRRPSVRIRHLADVLRRDREEPPTELRYRQWAAYISFSAAFSGTTGPSFPRPFRSAFLASGSLPSSGPLSTSPLLLPVDFRWLLTRIFPLARRWDTSRIERMTTCTLLELRMTVDCIRDADIIFQPYSAALSQRPEVFRAVALSRLRLWIRTTRSWELLLGERTEWFEQVSLGSLMSLHEVEGGRVMGGVAMDSHHIRSSGQIERLESEILRLQLELSVSVDRHTADMDRVQGEMASMQTEATRREGEMVQDAEGFGPEPEGLRFSRCGAGCSGGDHPEIRGPASWHGHYSCYRS